MGIFQKLSLKSGKSLPDEKRRQKRLSCDVSAEFVDPGRSIYRCKIIDLSESGVGIETCTNLRTGNIINIARPAIEAEVIWASNYKAGLRIIR